MTDKEFVLDTLLHDAIKVAMVNLYTGEYIFVKKAKTEAEDMSAATIGEYFQNLAAGKLIYPDDISGFRSYIDLGFLREKLSHKQDKLVGYFRCKSGRTYIWTMLEIIAQRKVSRRQPWVVFCWREADTDTCIMEDGLKRISGLYQEVMKINLTADSYMRLGSGSSKSKARASSKISRWFLRLAKTGSIYKNDLQNYLAFTDIQSLREKFLITQESIHLHYRQKVGDKFHWFSMEFIPSVEYTDENQVIMLYVRDINDEHVIISDFRHKIEYYANFDTLTGVWNQECFYKCCLEYSERKEKYPVAIMYADINGMREFNRKYGLTKGNEYIRSFADMLAGEFGKNACYRVGGDEFLILLEGESRIAVKTKFEAFRSILKKQGTIKAAVGYVWAEATEDLEGLLSAAESNMILDKQKYYKK